MKFVKTPLADLYLVEYQAVGDERGEFYRTFCQRELNDAGIKFLVRQVNISKTSKKGTIRGLHYQEDSAAEDKIVTCLAGSIYDVAVDLRRDSQTCGQWYAAELSGENKKALIIPKGFAHGFQALTDDVMMQYIMSEYYSPEAARGLVWDDSDLAVNWPIEPTVISEKDRQWPTLGAHSV